MLSSLQSFTLPVINFLVSFFFFLVCAVIVLSIYGLFDQGSGVFSLIPMLPVGESFVYGAVIGAAHGLIMAAVVRLRRSDSLFGISVSSFYATEILILMIYATVVIRFLAQLPDGTKNSFRDGGFQNFIMGIVILILWFVIASIIFLLPSIIIGIINKFALDMTKSLPST